MHHHSQLRNVWVLFCFVGEDMYLYVYLSPVAPGTEVIGSCKAPDVCARNHTWVSAKADAHVTAEPSPAQKCLNCFSWACTMACSVVGHRGCLQA